MKTKSTYLQSYKQIEAPGTLHKHLTVYQSQSDIFHPSFDKTAKSYVHSAWKAEMVSIALLYVCKFGTWYPCDIVTELRFVYLSVALDITRIQYKKPEVVLYSFPYSLSNGIPGKHHW